MGKAVGHAMSKLLIGKHIILTTKSKKFLNWSGIIWYIIHYSILLYMMIFGIG